MASKGKALSQISAVCLATAIPLVLLSLSGCSGSSSDQAPTNTANSQYQGSGKTAADNSGSPRLQGHRGLAGK